MPAKKTSAADSLAAELDTIIRKAPALREAGVLAVSVGQVGFTLRPPDPPAGEEAQGLPQPPSNPLEDPATYGRRDGFVPGFGAPTGDDFIR